MKNKWKQSKIKKKKQVEALENLKSKEQTKTIEVKCDNKNNQSIAANTFNDLIKKRKSILNELYESIDKNKLYFEYVGPSTYVSF